MAILDRGSWLVLLRYVILVSVPLFQLLSLPVSSALHLDDPPRLADEHKMDDR